MLAGILGYDAVRYSSGADQIEALLIGRLATNADEIGMFLMLLIATERTLPTRSSQ